MKYTNLLAASAILFFTTISQAANVDCTYDVRGYDMTEGVFKILVEDSYEDKTIQATPETCVQTAIKRMNEYRSVSYKVKGKNFSYAPSGLHVEIEITNNGIVALEADKLNAKILETACVEPETSFEFGATPFSADVKAIHDCN